MHYNFKLRLSSPLKSCIYFALAVLCLLEQHATAEAPLTLQSCFEQALRTHESIELSFEQSKLAKARYDEAFAALLPQVRATTTQRYRNDPSFGRNTVANNDLAIGNSSRALSKKPFESTITIQQPLFTGFREYFSMQAFNAEYQAATFEQERRRELLYQNVAEIFYQTSYYQEDEALLSSTASILTQRIEELKKFITLGKSRESELQAALAEKASVDATREQTRGLYAASAEMLSFFIGAPVDSLAIKHQPHTPALPELPILLEKGANRFDQQALRLRAEGADNMVTAARRGHWPQLSAQGTYYTYEDPELNRDWEMMLRLDVPLFEGGAIDARIDQTKSQQRIARLASQQLKRAIVRDITTAYKNIAALEAEIKALTTSSKAAERNYQAQQADYAKGVVTNVDVLTALRTWQDAKRRLIAAQARYDTARATLDVTVGGIS